MSLQFNWTERAGPGEKASSQVVLATALALAAEAHHDDYDANGEPLLFHVIRVASAMAHRKPWIFDGILVGLLHDAAEGTAGATLHQPENNAEPYIIAGDHKVMLTRRALNALALLKRSRSTPYQEYIRKVAMDPLAIMVKLADLDDNLQVWRMRKLDKKTRDRLWGRYLAARHYLIDVQWAMKNWTMA